MALSNRLSLKLRFFLRSNAYPRRGKPRLRFIPQFIQLEDRCVPAFIPTLTSNVSMLSEVLATPAGLSQKLVTIMNNSNEMVYPILFDANSTLDGTAGKVVRINLTNGGSGYTSAPTVNITGGGGSGAEAEAVIGTIDGQSRVVAINLTSPGAGYTSTPTVMFSGGGGTDDAIATATISNLQPNSPPTSLYDPLDPYNQTYRGYIGEFNPATMNVELGLKPGNQLTLQVPLVLWDGGRLFFASNGAQPFQSPTDPGNPLQNNAIWNYVETAPRFVVNADFRDPADGRSNPNGRVMWYHAPVPHDFGTDGPGQLAEWTIRDPQLVNFAPNMPSSQVQTIFNYDVSYVDNLTLPAGMVITNVPVPNRLPPGYNGPPIPPANYAVLGTDLTIPQMQQAMAVFTKTDPTQLNSDLGNYFGGRGYDQFYFPDSIKFQKLPAGYNLFALAPDNFAASHFDPNRFQLTSGGHIARIDTMSTGTTTVGSNQITDIAHAVIEKLASGMLPTNLQYFKQGTKIIDVNASTNTVTLDTPSLGNVTNGMAIVNSTMGSTNGSTAAITGIDPAVLSFLFPGMVVTGPGITSPAKILTIAGTTVTLDVTPAAGSASAGTPYVFTGQVSFTFVGSQFTSSTGTVNVNANTIQNIDPNVGIYLRPGMLVIGPGITAYTKIVSISADYKTVTLDVAPGAGSGAYAFTGAPSSYVVSTLINNWYSWADYYVAHVNATPQTSSGRTHGHTDPKLRPREDPNTLILEGLDPSVVSQLKVGMVVRGPGIAENPNPSDPSQNTTIAKILSATSIRLSLPATAATGTYSFSPPVPIARSNDARPYTLTFTTPEQQQKALEFAETVYDVMQGFSLLSEPSYLSKSALLLQYVIGGNIGTFILQNKELPTIRLDQLRDGLKSVLRGVADFSKTPEFGPGGVEQWYPDPKVATPGAMINGQPANFGVYNLNPYVWFIHIKLGMSGYGFSLDDDTANAQDAANSIQVAYGGTAATAPGTADQKLANLQLYSFGAPFGTLQDQGYIDTTSGVAAGYNLTQVTVIGGLSLETVGKLKAFDAKNGLGALVTGYGMTPESSRVFLTGPANPNPNTPSGANASYVVLQQPTPEHLLNPTRQNGPTGPYIFSGFSTTLPVIASLTPASGAVGTQVTLTGSGFTKALGVTFNGFPATTFMVNSAASITVTVPAGATSGRIGVRGPAGTGYSTTDFTVTGFAAVLTLAPTITSLDKTSGPLGTVVTLTGTGFTGVTGVTFNGGGPPGTPATQFQATSDTTLTVTVPVGATGTGTITVTTPAGSATSAQTFTVNPPSIGSFAPPRGAVGTVVTLRGTGFTGATAVTFNGTAAPSYFVFSDTTIQATVPTGATTGPIAVTTSGGTGNSGATTFDVTPTVIPSIASFSPGSGPVGTPVTLTGTGFTGATAVTFNGIAAAGFTVVNDATIQATVPTLATTGPIAVTNSAGTGTSAANFTVTAATVPVITSFSPTFGPDGTPVTLTGTSFTGATNVSFNGTQAPFIAISDTEIDTQVPSGATTGPISVTNAVFTGFSAASFFVSDDNIITQLSNNTVGEKLPVGTLVGTFNSFPSGTYTYQLPSGGDNNSFTLAGNQLLSAAIFDFHVKPQYHIIVKTFQAGVEVATDLFTINIELTATRLAFVATPRNGLPLRGFDATGNQLFQLVPFTGYNGNMAVAVGDVNGDLVPDLIVSTLGSRARVKVFDGTTLATTPVELISFQAFGKSGAFVTVGDLNGDNHADIIVGKSKGSGRIRAYDGQDAGKGIVTQLADITAFPSGGVRVAIGDFNGDSTPDVIAAKVRGAAIRVFNGAALAAGNRVLLGTVSSFRGGSFVSAGDFNNDNRVDIVVGRRNSSSRIRVFNAANPSQVLLNFDAVPGASRGARVAVTDLNGDNTPDIVAALARGTPNVLVFDGANGNQLLSVPAATGYTHGLLVAGNGVLGSPLHLQSGPAAGTGAANLTDDQLAPVVGEAIQLFADAGVSSLLIDQLKAMDVQIADLGGSTLGVAYANAVKLDSNAAGHGWSLDGTVGTDEVDLLSVLVHEFGHMLGLEHDAGFMDDLIDLGERRLPTAHELEMLFSGRDLDGIVN